jgi:hypothetical protein
MTRVFLLLAGLAVTGTAFGAQPLGRLFFTPAEREQLDIARIQKRVPETAAMQAAEPRVSTQTITYSGIVRRSDGKSTLWLNNRPADEKNALSDLALSGRVRPDGAVTLRVPETGGSIDLRVGQRAELQTGRVVESRPGSGEKAAPKADTPAKSDAPSKADAPSKPDNAAKVEPASKPDAVPPKDAADRKSETAATPAVKDGVSHRELQQRTVGSK